MHLCMIVPSLLSSTLYIHYLLSYRNSLLSRIIIIPENNPSILCILLWFSYDFLTETEHFLIFCFSSVLFPLVVRLFFPFAGFCPYRDEPAFNCPFRIRWNKLLRIEKEILCTTPGRHSSEKCKISWKNKNPCEKPAGIWNHICILSKLHAQIFAPPCQLPGVARSAWEFLYFTLNWIPILYRFLLSYFRP